jgi:hypothetical protein
MKLLKVEYWKQKVKEMDGIFPNIFQGVHNSIPEKDKDPLVKNSSYNDTKQKLKLVQRL